MNNVFFYQNPIGRISIAENGTAITHVYFDGHTVSEDEHVQETALLQEAGR